MASKVIYPENGTFSRLSVGSDNLEMLCTVADAGFPEGGAPTYYLGARFPNTTPQKNNKLRNVVADLGNPDLCVGMSEILKLTNHMTIVELFPPPANEVVGKLCFHWCLSVHEGWGTRSLPGGGYLCLAPHCFTTRSFSLHIFGSGGLQGSERDGNIAVPLHFSA